MSVGFSAVLAVIFLIVGIVSFQNRAKTENKVWTVAYVISFALCIVCVFYIIAASLLLGGIK